MESKLSYGTVPPTGTPITGRGVIDAITPGRAAAIPAIPMKTLQPFSRAFSITDSKCLGVLWADAT